MAPSILQRAAELAREGQPFALATVVWRRGPTSGREGAKALVLPGGTLEGWVAGSCARDAVVREGLAALEDGRPRLVVLGSAEELTRAMAGEAVAVPTACASEGALAVHLDPVLPPPHVVAVGRSPAAATLAALAEALGWRATLAPDSSSLAGLALDPSTAVVVATQGEDDEGALLQALATPAGYVGLVASRKRADAVLAWLGDHHGFAHGPAAGGVAAGGVAAGGVAAGGVAAGDLARVRAPAGLDLGSIRPAEIAVAVLAELVALRAAGGLTGGAGGLAGGAGGSVTGGQPAGGAGAPAEREVFDPVCGMSVDPASSRYRTERDGITWWFCGAGCQHRFELDPADFAGRGR